MKKLLLLTLLFLYCNASNVSDPLKNLNICAADDIEDILGIWYTTSQRAGIQPGYYVTDSTLWYFERAPLSYGGLTSMDSLKIIIEYHPGDIPYDPNKHRQSSITLSYDPGRSNYGTLVYGNANFTIPNCDTLIVEWIDNTIHRLIKKH